MNKMVTIAQVDGAFDTLLEVMARECDPETFQTTLFVKDDILQMLTGEWKDKAAGEHAPAATRPEDGPEAQRCPDCGQSLVDIQFSMFACPGCYAAFGDEAVETALRPF